ncbi:Sel1-repeat-containing protein YbeT [Nymphon striatum]|nr:Sel1-repeat-containing protein YbeT [Nymphon striatum]
MEFLKKIEGLKKPTVNKPAINTYAIKKLRNKVLKVYGKLGETSYSVDAINFLAQQYLIDFRKSTYYKNQHKKIVRDTLASGDYQRFPLFKDDSLKLSLHVIPKGSQIPMHAHPGMFSLTLVDQGSIKIRHDSWGRLHPLNANDSTLKFKILGEKRVSTGLPVMNNLHQIQVESEFAVFLSVRIKKVSSHPLIDQLFNKKTFALSGLLIGALIPFVPSIGASNNSVSSALVGDNEVVLTKDYSEMVLASEKEEIQLGRSLKRHQLADKLRLSKQYESQVDAISYYAKEALNGDAYSQYWLGVMYLDGSGITEDDDMALEWISKAAKQNYQPAEELLAHLLATDFDMDC